MDSFLRILQDHLGQDKVAICFTQRTKHAIEIANDVVIHCDAIICIGGDGTFHEVVNGVMLSSKPSTPILCIPAGTGNDFCKAQNYIFNPERILRALENPQIICMDVMEILMGTSKKYCANVCDIGLGGYTTNVLNRLRSQGFKVGLSYKIASVIGLLQYKPQKIQIQIDDCEVYTDRILMLAVCNSSTFGNGYVIHPGADPRDAKLGVVIFKKVTIMDYLKQYKKLKMGQFIQHPQVKYVDCKSISIESNESLPFEIDGEFLLITKFVIQIIPSKLHIIDY